MPTQNPPQPLVVAVDPAAPATDVLHRLRAIVLEPTRVPQLANQQLRPTAYVTNRLIVAHKPDGNPDVVAREYVTKAAGSIGLRTKWSGDTGFQLAELEPAGYEPVVVDAWRVLQIARGLAATQPAIVAGVSLNHVVQVATRLSGDPFDSSNGTLGRTVHYERSPVSWVGPAPALPNPPAGRRSPVVAVLDTGCAPHPWLPDTVVTRAVFLDRVPVGLPGSGEEGPPDVLGPLDGRMDPYSGHGTFCVGLVRQTCPAAQILSVKVLEADGATEEYLLVRALWGLHDLAARAQSGQPGGQHVDVISLSLGHYPENVADMASSALARVLLALSQLGVVVVASAGNDAITREMMPALLTPHPGGVIPERTADPPLISVGALNPDGTIALFSNTSEPGGWVCEFAPGADVVSTMPRTDAGANPAHNRPDPSGGTRADLDPDGYGRRAGSDGAAFGRWSGTSFAAPILAGRIAAALPPIPSTVAPEVAARAGTVTRAWAAIGSTVRRYGP